MKRMPPAPSTVTGQRPLKTLERVVSKAGIGSRVEARLWIEAGRMTVNGRVVRDPDRWVDMQSDLVCFDGEPLESRERVYLLLNKPRGYLTTYKDPQGRPTVYDLIADVGTFVSPVGRLDLDTAGLLLMTNDTQFKDRVTNPSSHIPKTYVVTASTRLTAAQLQRLRNGIELADGPTRPTTVTRLPDADGRTRFEIVLTEGRNRQVRRMVEALGAKVVELVRIKIGPIAGDVPPSGKWRALTAAELAAINGWTRPSDDVKDDQ
jgi:23S rRNA pseudouridine2605 synthase